MDSIFDIRFTDRAIITFGGLKTVKSFYQNSCKEEQEMPGKWLDYGARFYDAQ
jgi:hypothetical protein